MKLQLNIACTHRFLAGVAVLFWACASLSAQPPKAGEGPALLVLDKDWGTKDFADELKQFQVLHRGEQPITDANKVLLDRGAQWYAYRLTHSIYHEPKVGGKTIHEICKEALDQIVEPKPSGRPAKQSLLTFKEEFEKRFVPRLQEVTKNPRFAARINAAIILAKLAEKGCEETADVFVEIIKDPMESEGVKLWAFRGLKNLLALGYGENGTPMRSKERESRCIVALLDYLAAKPKLSEDAPAEELAASIIVRREAIAALGQTRFPGVAVAVDKKTTKIGQMTALELLKVMRSEGQPRETTLGEQVAAAVGVCHLQAKLLEQYNPDYAAYQVGKFVFEFCRQYTESDVGEQNKRKPPWKAMAASLGQGLNELKNEGSNRESAAYVEKICAQAEPMLREVFNGTKPDRKAFGEWLEQNLPKHATLYQGVASAVVGVAEKTNE
jgi:hypothetical protein